MERKDLLSLNFYNKSECFYGSEKGVRYRVEKYVEEPSEDLEDSKDPENTENTEKKEPRLKVTLWPEPFNFDKTPDEQKTVIFFPFTEEGLVQTAECINNGLKN